MKVFVVCDDPAVQIAGHDDALALDMVAHYLGMASHDNDNSAPSVFVAGDRTEHPVDVRQSFDPKPNSDAFGTKRRNISVRGRSLQTASYRRRLRHKSYRPVLAVSERPAARVALRRRGILSKTRRLHQTKDTL